jgi:pyridoxamine 5'-phosphate oxidase
MESGCIYHYYLPMKWVGIRIIWNVIFDRANFFGFWILDFGFWILDFGLFFGSEPRPLWAEQMWAEQTWAEQIQNRQSKIQNPKSKIVWRFGDRSRYQTIRWRISAKIWNTLTDVFMIPPWRSPLLRALHRNRSLANSRYVQLATMRTDGRPANRTVVFRGFLLNSDHLQFVADARSEKMEQLSAQTWGELCWYFPKTREQFRILGQVHLVTAAEPHPDWLKARRVLWNNLSEATRSQFAWSHPGHLRTEESQFSVDPSQLVEPVETFGLLLLDPIQVDHLELRGEPQHRTIYRKGEGHEWTMVSVNP